MTMTTENPTTIEADPIVPTITIVREFAAPRAKVFRAWTDPAYQARLLAEGRYGDFVRLIALLNGGVPRLCNVDGLEECCAARLRAGGICTVAELQRSTVARIVGCFPQNDRAQVTRWAPRWIEHAALLHEGDEAALCALAGWLLFPARRPRRPARDWAILGVIGLLVATSLYELVWLYTVTH